MSQPDTQRPVIGTHAEAVAVASDPIRFSSAVSRFIQVPNGLDGEAHARARALTDPFFSAERMAELLPQVTQVAAQLLGELDPASDVDAVGELGSRFAVRAQSRWLGWSDDLEQELLDWMDANHEATRSGDLARTGEVAQWFDRIITRLVEARLAPAPVTDVTAELVQLRDADGSPAFTQPELVSILRNWTGGDLGSLALCTGVVCHFLATHPEQQQVWRAAPDEWLDKALDEVLRLDDPFVSNRRITTCPVHVAGRDVEAGQQVIINWTLANQDPAAFANPTLFDPEAHADANLVYGTGPHYCPGRPLATLELRVLTRALLDRFTIAPGHGKPERAEPPLGGWASMPISLAPLA